MESYPCLLPAPGTLEIHDSSAAENWKDWKMAWEHYSLASGLREKPEEVKVSTLLTIIGPEARKVFSTFSRANTGDSKKMGAVLAKLEEYCCPRQNVTFERYKFNTRQQAVGQTFDHYVTELRQLAGKCAFETITTDELLRDRIVFGIIDSHVREHLLREDKRTLKMVLEVECFPHLPLKEKEVPALPKTPELLKQQEKPLGPSTKNCHGPDAYALCLKEQLH